MKFEKVTEANVDTIVPVDLHDEASFALEAGETIWMRKNAEATQNTIVVFESGRVGFATNGPAVWGLSCVTIGGDGNAPHWKAELDESGPLDERLWIDGHGRECCCYQGCDSPSSPEWIDRQGDRCCSLHWAQDFDYVEIVAGAPDPLSDETISAAYVDAMGKRGWTVDVRPPICGEAEGTYWREYNGTLQILGSSIRVPEDYRLDKERVLASLNL